MLMLIDGGWTKATDGLADPVLNPVTNQPIADVPRAGEADVARAVAAAQQGKLRMAALPSHRRYEILEAVARRIEANQVELGELLCRENGKRIGETTSEVGVAARVFRGYAEEAKRLFGKSVPLDSIPGRERSMAITRHEPLGVVVAIVPFNYPVELWSHKVAGGLAAGNAVITKTPEDCPLAVIEISRYLEEAGLPKAAHQVLTGGRETGEALVRAEGVQMIAMTGSTAAGRRILEVAARTLKKVHLELGGNDATIICEDANIDQVAAALVAGRFTSGNGQICCAVKRVLVHRSIFDRLLSDVTERARALKVGDPLDAGTDVGPLINTRAAERVEAQVSQAVADGAKIVTGGRRNGNFFEPTILTGVAPGTPAFDDETFGPVLPLILYDDFEEALRLANDSPFGLQAAIFTRDVRRIMRAYEVLDVGTVVVNHTTAVRVETLPFGGNKASGNGREGIHETLEIANPADAMALGIRTVYQELSLLPHLSVAENMLMGRMPCKRLGWVIDWNAANRIAGEVLAEFGFADIDPEMLVRDLSVARQQIVEIAKALVARPRILILDEPTAVLSALETDRLFAKVRSLAASGTTVLYISHRLEEIFQIADEFVVLKDGRSVLTGAIDQFGQGKLIEAMVGRPLEAIFPERNRVPGNVVLEVEHLTQHGTFADIGFSIRAGEIVGMFGLMGSGRTEIAKAIFGATPADEGSIRLAGHPARIVTPKEAVKSGIAMITEDRKGDGLALDASILDNAGLASFGRVSRFGVIDSAERQTLVDRQAVNLSIRPKGTERPVRQLSGGNQQKVVLAKWLLVEGIKLFIFDEPTRGVDIATKVEIYRMIADLALQGAAVLLISSEMPEVIGLSDRLIIMREGRIAAELTPDEFSMEVLFMHAAGIQKSESGPEVLH